MEGVVERKPDRGKTIVLRPRQDQQVELSRTQADARGRFAFDPVPAGLYLICPLEGKSPCRRVEVRGGEVAKIRLGTGDKASERLSRLRVAMDMPPGKMQWGQARLHIGGEVFSPENYNAGPFPDQLVFEDMPSGAAQLRISISEVPGGDAWAGWDTLTLEPGKTKSHRFQFRSSGVSLRVLDSSRTPVEGAEVFLAFAITSPSAVSASSTQSTPSGQSPQAVQSPQLEPAMIYGRTDGDGRIRILGLPPGAYPLRLQHGAWGAPPHRVELASDTSMVDTTFTMAPGAPISLKPMFQNHLMEKVEILAYSTEGKLLFHKSHPTEHNGWLSSGALLPGNYRMVVQQGGLVAQFDLDVKSARPIRRQVDLVPGGWLERSAEGTLNPWSHFAASAYLPSSPSQASSRLLTIGQAEVRGDKSLRTQLIGPLPPMEMQLSSGGTTDSTGIRFRPQAGQVGRIAR